MDVVAIYATLEQGTSLLEPFGAIHRENAMRHCALLLVVMLCGLLAIGTDQPGDIAQVTLAEKAQLYRAMSTWPSSGEFFATEAFPLATRYLHIVLALDENDVGSDFYPYMALSRLLHDGSPRNRQYAARHFAQIRHAWLKMFWAMLLFDYSQECTPEIIQYLNGALQDQRRGMIQACAGPEFDRVRLKIIAARLK